MSTRIDSTERLLNLVIALLGTRLGRSKSYLRQHVNGYAGPAAVADEDKAVQAFNRMFERDKKLLLELGIPIRTKGVSGSGDAEQALYLINPAEYRVPEVRLDESSMALVSLAAKLWADAALGEAAQSALRKIATRSGTDWYDDDTTTQSRIRTVEPAFEPLWTALRNHHPVTFSYRRAGAAVGSARTVQPWGLGSKYGQWYLAGFDVVKGEERNFRLSRITSDVVVDTANRFPRPENFHIATVLERLGTGQPHTADIAVPSGSAHALRSRAASAEPLPDADQMQTNYEQRWNRDGWEVLRVVYREPELMADDVAALGAQAHVLAPAELRDAVAQRLRAAAEAAASMPGDTGELSWHVPVDLQAPPTKNGRDRLVRLLSMVPYLVANPGVKEAEILSEFGITAAEWAKDMDTLNVTGLPGYYHGDLMDVTSDQGQVFIRDAETLASPLRLSREEACTVLVGLRALTAVTGPEQSSALQQASTQIAAVAGDEAWLGDAVGLHLVSGPEIGTITALQQAIHSRRACAITYLVTSRDELSERTVEPRKLFSMDSVWYLRAWCRRSAEMRSFRVDRIQSMADAGPQEQVPDSTSRWQPHSSIYNPGSNDTVVQVLADTATAQRLAPAYNASLFAVPTVDPTERVGVQFLVGDTNTVPALMARLGGRASVVSPVTVHHESLEWLRAAAASYDASHAVGETDRAVPSPGR